MKTTKKKREPAAAADAAAVPAKPEQGQQAKAAPVIALASNCNVKGAAELKKSLGKLLEERAVSVDVRSLERVDTATLQLLCAFVRDRAAHDRKVEWVGDSQVLQDAARLLGVSEMLGLPRSDADKLGAAA